MKNINWMAIAIYTLSASLMFYVLIRLLAAAYLWYWNVL